LSGGIDSAIVAVIAAFALGPQNVLGVSMPSRYSSDGSKTDAQSLAKNLGIKFTTIPIEPMFDAFLKQLEPEFVGRNPDVTEENLQARIRGTALMALSNKFNYLLLSTGNKSEVAMGYCTLYGDTNGGLAVISDVFKTKVYALANWINENIRPLIPQDTISKPPSAELRPDQKDSDSLPPYDVLDTILSLYLEESKAITDIAEKTHYDWALISKVLKTVYRNEYKRKQLPPGLRITKKAFGTGRQMPLAQGWPCA
jgi:NAD+ synthase (glutamine-hydrolysing)